MLRAWLMVALSLSSLLTACGTAPEPTLTPGPPPTATLTVPPPASATPVPTVTPVPTPTTVPTATATATPPATATVTASPSPAATPTPAVRSPLTGLGLAEPQRAQWQPLAVQIDNDPEARPQTGLNAASVVIETPTEAGLTRLTAIYLDQDAAVVGPIRSARLVNLEIVPEYQALLVSVGGSDGVIQRIGAAGVPHINVIGGIGEAATWRAPDRPAPFNLYGSTQGLRQAGRTLRLERTAQLAAGAFGPLSALPAATSAPSGLAVAIPYPAGNVRFAFDAGSGRYQRSVGGELQRDAIDGSVVAPTNVVVQYTEFTATDIIEDSLGSRSLAVRLRGQGELMLLRDGKLLRGTWQREGLSARTVYRDQTGQPLTLAPGQTWIALVAPGTAIATS